MTSEIRPGFILPIRRQLQLTAETDTYYCRAVIRNSNTNAVLATVDLTDAGGYRFTYNWTVPSFSNETYFDITLTVYTDSGYTEISNIYGSTLEQYVVRNQVNFGGGGGYSGITYAEVEKIIKKEIEKIKIPEQVDLSDVTLLLTNLSRRNVDLTPILEAIATTKNEIKGKIDEISIPEVDNKPIIDALGENLTAIRELDGNIKADREQVNGAVNNIKDASSGLDTVIEKGKKYFTADIDRLEGKIDGLGKKLKSIPFLVTKQDDDEI